MKSLALDNLYLRFKVNNFNRLKDACVNLVLDPFALDESLKMGHISLMWIVKYSPKAAKQADKLPKRVKEALNTLVNEIRILGPVRGNWPNYSKLDDSAHHCHLKKGHPTFVAVWQEVSGNIQMVRVIYAGTHEKAPY